MILSQRIRTIIVVLPSGTMLFLRFHRLFGGALFIILYHSLSFKKFFIILYQFLSFFIIFALWGRLKREGAARTIILLCLHADSMWLVHSFIE